MVTKEDLDGMGMALVYEGGRIEVVCNEAFYSTLCGKMNDWGTLKEKKNTSGILAGMSGGNEDQA